jgi:hypothetical protein
MSLTLLPTPPHVHHTHRGALVKDADNHDGNAVQVYVSNPAAESILGITAMQWFETLPLKDDAMQAKLDACIGRVYECTVWWRAQGGLLIKHARCIATAPTTPQTKKRTFIPAATPAAKRFAFQCE